MIDLRWEPGGGSTVGARQSENAVELGNFRNEGAVEVGQEWSQDERESRRVKSF